MLWAAKDNGKPLDPMQVLKLVYIAHGWTLGLLDRPLIDESVEAWTYGPVVPSVYRQYKRYGGGYITEVPSSEPDIFSPKERSLLQQVWKQYSRFTALQLSAMTHKPGTPWAITRQVSGPGAMIPNDLLRDHYKQLSAVL
jgi:uncharacterized phage-associated protein